MAFGDFFNYKKLQFTEISYIIVKLNYVNGNTDVTTNVRLRKNCETWVNDNV